jgi:hypothetical protein
MSDDVATKAYVDEIAKPIAIPWEAAKATTYKLKAKWDPEAAKDLTAYHYIPNSGLFFQDLDSHKLTPRQLEFLKYPPDTQLPLFDEKKPWQS